MYINQFSEGLRINENLLVTQVVKGISNNGMAYLTLGFQDKTGRIDGKIWDVNEHDQSLFETGVVLNVVADVLDYRGSLQLKVISIRPLTVGQYNLEDLTISSKIPLDTLKAELESTINEIKDENMHRLVEELILRHYDKFIIYPAASRNHHEYVSGLLEHTLSMARLAKMIAGNYEGIDLDLLLGGVLLHDIGKTIELSGPIATKYTVAGKLLGHISLMSAEVLKVAEELKIEGETPILLTHMVLSHHGKMEFGSPVVPMIKEAIILSFVDDLDAKLKMVDKALDEISEGEFSQRLWALDNNVLYKPIKR